MQTYWDTPEDERHALTVEQVEKFIEIERAEQGCYIPDAPVAPEDPNPLDLERITLYRLTVKDPTDRYSWAHDSMMTFRTREAAEAAGQAAIRVRSVNDVEAVQPSAGEITEISVVTAASYAKHASALERAAAARATYDKELSAYNDAVKKAQDAGSGIWDDWHRCRERATELDGIRKAHAKHLELAEGAETIARRFTVKAFGVEDAATALGLEVEALDPDFQVKEDACDPF